MKKFLPSGHFLPWIFFLIFLFTSRSDLSAENYCGYRKVAYTFRKETLLLRAPEKNFAAHLLYQRNTDGSLYGFLVVEGVELPIKGYQKGKELLFSLSTGKMPFSLVLKEKRASTFTFSLSIKISGESFRIEGAAVKEGISNFSTAPSGIFSGLWMFKFKDIAHIYFNVGVSGHLIFASEIRGMTPAQQNYWIGKLQSNGQIFMANVNCGNCRDAGTLIKGAFYGSDSLAGELVTLTFTGERKCSKFEAVKLGQKEISLPDLTGVWVSVERDKNVKIELKRTSSIHYRGTVYIENKKKDVYASFFPDRHITLFIDNTEILAGSTDDKLPQKLVLKKYSYNLCYSGKQKGSIEFIKQNNGFCGWSTDARCTSDSDCEEKGCSGEICAGKDQNVLSTCVWRDCFDKKKFPATCRCINGGCRWETHRHP